MHRFVSTQSKIKLNTESLNCFISICILDKNECSLYKACQYECINAVGSYKCTCPPGYELQPSGKCKGKNKKLYR